MEIAGKAKNLFNKLESGDGFAPVPGKAVYAVFVMNLFSSGAEHLLYIGSSKNVEKRRRNGKHPYMVAYQRFHNKFKCVFIKYFYSENYLEDEKILISYYKPILNIRK